MGVQVFSPRFNPSTPFVGPDICAPEFSWAHTGLVYAAMVVGGVLRNVVNRGNYRQPTDAPADSTRIVTQHGRGRGFFSSGLDATGYTTLQGQGVFSILVVASASSYEGNQSAISIRFGTDDVANLCLLYPFGTNLGNGARVFFNNDQDINQNDGAIADGFFHAFHYVARSSTDRELYADAQSIGTSSLTKTFGSSTDTITLGAWNSTTQPLAHGNLILACVWAGVAHNQQQIQQPFDDWFGPFRPRLATIGKAPVVVGDLIIPTAMYNYRRRRVA